MGARLFTEPGKDEGGEEEEWHPASVTLLPVQVGSLTATSPPQPLPKGQSLLYVALIRINLEFLVKTPKSLFCMDSTVKTFMSLDSIPKPKACFQDRSSGAPLIEKVILRWASLI